MEKLKLSAVPDDKPVKLTVELPAAVHRDLVAYAEVLGGETGQRRRTGEARRPDAGTLHVDRPSLLASAPRKANDTLIPPVEIDRDGCFGDTAG